MEPKIPPKISDRIVLEIDDEVELLDEKNNLEYTKLEELTEEERKDPRNAKIIKDIENLNYVNARRKEGEKLKQYKCYRCLEINNHLTKDCQYRYCKICMGKHSQYKCPYNNICQICGADTHSTEFCNNIKGIKTRILQNIRCNTCKRFGHSSIMCNIRKRSFSNKKWKYKRYYNGNYRIRNKSYNFRRNK